jgi:hypothetical protein
MNEYREDDTSASSAAGRASPNTGITVATPQYLIGRPDYNARNQTIKINMRAPDKAGRSVFN